MIVIQSAIWLAQGLTRLHVFWVCFWLVVSLSTSSCSALALDGLAFERAPYLPARDSQSHTYGQQHTEINNH